MNVGNNQPLYNNLCNKINSKEHNYFKATNTQLTVAEVNNLNINELKDLINGFDTNQKVNDKKYNILVLYEAINTNSKFETNKADLNEILTTKLKELLDKNNQANTCIPLKKNTGWLITNGNYGIYRNNTGDFYIGKTAGFYTRVFGEHGTFTWDNGKKNGQGIFTEANGDIYEGEFKDDKKHGQGTLTWTCGSKYVGEFKDDQFNGQGIFTEANGDIYEGEFKDDQRNGHGAFTWADGKTYVGEFKNSQRNGHGTLTWADGDTYVGEFKDDQRNGHGAFTWADGKTYVGEFKNSQRNGHGTLT
ncbi:MAG: MORN repeat-containing protein, partial [Candidatus Marinamargulisbacteria bacterium]